MHSARRSCNLPCLALKPINDNRKETNTMSHKLLLALAACLPIALAGCGGGGGTPASSTASPSGNTGGNPNSVSVRGLDVTHVEMTDIHSYRSTTPGSNLTASLARTEEVICQGGNECREGAYVSSNGTRTLLSFSGDSYDAAFHARILNSRNNVHAVAGGYYGAATPQFYGLIGDYSTVYTAKDVSVFGSAGYFVSRVYSAAMGELYAGRPPTIVDWHGNMIGTDMRYGSTLTGDAYVSYNLTNNDNTAYVRISNIAELPTTDGSCWHCAFRYNGPTLFEWEGIPVQPDGSFYMQGHSNNSVTEQPHYTLGFIEGDFYGPNGAETAGVFERDFVSGGWVASKGLARVVD